MKNRIAIAVFAAGASGIAAQLLLLRELLVVFAGNELSIGIILANWLILEAAGCYFIGRKAEDTRFPYRAFALIAVFFSLSLPAMLYASRILKNLLGVSIGESVGLVPMAYSSFLILLPPSLAHGALFTFGCRIYSLSRGLDSSPAGRVYVYETAGTIAGGLAWTYLLIPYMHSFQSAGALAMLNFAACALLLSGRREHRASLCALLALFISSAVFLSGGLAGELHGRSLSSRWRRHNVVRYENSIYGNITVIESAGHYTFFMDGIPAVSSRVPDIAAVEEFAHIPLLSHPAPRKVLVLTGGAGGLISEILKHPCVELLEYAELDPLLIELIRRYPAPLTEAELENPKVEISHEDGRLFLRKSERGYDLILSGLSEPSDLQANRFFTLEFFRLARARLGADGIFAVRLPGSMAYINDELKNLNSCVFGTLSSVFPHVRVIPGEGDNMFIASESPGIFALDMELLTSRLEERGIESAFAVPWHIEQKLNPAWGGWFMDFISESSPGLNRDFTPRGLFYHAAFWNSVFAPGLRGAFRGLERLTLPKVIAFFAVIIVILSVSVKKTGKAGAGVPLCAATTGFAGMIFDLALIFAFQAVYGYVFHWLGLLVTSFMAGSAAGALFASSILRRRVDEFKLFVKIDLAVMLFALLLPVMFMVLQPYLDSPAVLPFVRPVFMLFLFVGGGLAGAQFPPANRLYIRRKRSLSGTAGLIYGADLAGGWLGGMAGGVILLPLLGLSGACITVFLLKLSSFTIIRGRGGV